MEKKIRGKKGKYNIGDRIEMLLIIGREYPKKVYKQGKKLAFKCKCDCGNEILIHGGNIGKAVSCGCYRRNPQPKRRKPRLHLATHMFREYKHGAKLRGKEFNLTKEEFTELIYKACYYCGTEHSMEKIIYSRSKSPWVYKCNGVDRLDNTLGYTNSNSVSCCKICNQAKHTFSAEEFLSWIKKVYDFQSYK